jgi:mannosyltransferase OCH1-like enzyme
MSVDYYYDQDDETRKQIDELLHQNAILQSNLGMDSTPEEKKSANDQWMVLAMKIRDLDSKFYHERIIAQHQ